MIIVKHEREATPPEQSNIVIEDPLGCFSNFLEAYFKNPTNTEQYHNIPNLIYKIT